ncbi:MAG: outer membrane protein transport protein [Saprospiraceae bacterium]|nr:outer membrane protein transport protein [Saprospiraceae bacterium]
MKNYILNLVFLLASTGLLAQAGQIMQGIGSVNMSMGGAATAQPLDINGPLQWNPAGISVFDENILSANVGLFFSSPKLYSTVPTQNGPFSGMTEDDRGLSPMPALAVVFGKKESKHTFGVSAFGVSGFGVTFPQSMTNPINMPQSQGGFGRIESNYLLFQVGLTYAYEISDNLSIGLAPTINYAALELAPNPLASPSPTLGYPQSNQASAIGYGGQIGVFYETEVGLKLGASYKSPQFFSDFDFENKYLDGSAAPNVLFNMDYPAIYSVGLGYSINLIDLAVDYRYVDYANTAGFESSGWTQTGSVAGFGWESISIISAGLQFNAIEKLPLRVGYTYSSNPINENLAFFSSPATAIIKNAFQAGVGYQDNERFGLNLTYHHGASGDRTKGPLLNPLMISENNSLGTIPNSEISYEMTTDMIMVGINYRLSK